MYTGVKTFTEDLKGRYNIGNVGKNTTTGETFSLLRCFIHEKCGEIELKSIDNNFTLQNKFKKIN